MRLSDRVALGSPTARLAAMAATSLLLAVPLAGAVIAGASPAAGLVTEDVEPGVVRIVDDGAGHDLEAKHPTYPYDMDNVYVTPDGTVWVSSSYRDTDNDANGPGGGLVWAVGQPDTARYPGELLCFRGTFEYPGLPGVTCYDLVAGTETKYLANRRMNAVAPAPDGTFWAVGHDGGLYHITPE